MINTTLVGSKIKSCRREKDWTQDELAEKVACVRQTISKWENGQLNFTVDELVRLCNVFDCDMGYLLGEYETKKHVAADIQKETGLSESAIEILRDNQKCAPENSLISTINFLIEQETPIAHYGEFRSMDDTGTSLSKIDTFFNTWFGDEHMYTVSGNGINRVEGIEDIMQGDVETKKILQGMDIFDNLALSEIGDILKSQKNLYLLMKGL